MPNPKKRKKILIFTVIAVVLVALTLVAVFKKREPVITVQAEKIQRRNLTEVVVANGKIQPVLQVTISPEVSGEITELAVHEGQFVHKGDLLLKINPDVYVAGLNQAKAGYESSLAGKTTATANLEKAETDYTRNKELFDRKLISESDFIGFKVARDVAEAQVESADDQVNVAKAAVDNAQDLLNKTTIVSPLDGTVTTLNSQLGERVLGTVQNEGTDHHDHFRFEPDGGARGHRRNGRGADPAGSKSAAGGGRLQRSKIRRHGHADRRCVQRFRSGCQRLQQQQPVAGGDEV